MATTSTALAFRGLSPDAIQFQADLAVNNDRAWFQPRTVDFEHLQKEPLKALIAALAERLAARGVPMLADHRGPLAGPAGSAGRGVRGGRAGLLVPGEPALRASRRWARG
ncbi:MAG TPA: DUF2461 family protein [Candidatus Binatia bacterium]|nr:DUF2461 family protein [Candidatus Binatia bacterium]